MKVLVSAYACEPGRGSEPGVGWNMACQIAKHHQVWVLTSNTHRPAIEAELARHQPPNLNFVYLDPFGWVYDWSYEGKRSQWSVYLHHYLWQIWAYFVARRLDQEISFDVAHHITYGRYSSPSFLVFLRIPFVWGPVGGAESTPKPFWQDFSRRAKIYETLRNLLRWVGELDPFVHLTARKSTAAIVTTPETATRLKVFGAKRIEFLPGQTGINQQEFARLEQLAVSSDETIIRFVSIGRLLHWKGFHLGIKAFAQTGLEQSEYWIIGEGPERERLEELANQLGIADRTFFLGRISREETFHTLAKCHVVVHPALHDFSPTVCLEAMVARRPVVCLNLGGPAIQITEETGFKIDAQTPEQAVTDMAKAMTLLAKDPDLRLRMGQAGHKRVREAFSWESKGQFFAQLYKEISTQDKSYVKLG
ncbi:glycosyltransferase family 4 protein [Brasilonema bromeliae]|uniref:Glycosyltransferase family 1 protein n=1 Tax=Brasilonema bromeliae SPC951 TaxID=385972 RepID=A0ABX1P6K6_9CYAN|nr:glycosyltransferase family 4 protein [Brasilonema bromeliae]NMG20020.1 glycosyltransferase family 1 protein [Brasilonema bromeliae SPC951]